MIFEFFIETLFFNASTKMYIFLILYLFQPKLLKWLIESISKCQSSECLLLHVNALQNSQHRRVAPLLINLLEDNCLPSTDKNAKNALLRRKIAVAAIKGLLSMDVDKVFDDFNREKQQKYAKKERVRIKLPNNLSFLLV